MRAAESQVPPGHPQLLCQKLYHRCLQDWYQPDPSFSHEGASPTNRHVRDVNGAFEEASDSCSIGKSHEHAVRVYLDCNEWLW